jgi:serine/threonine-protein kinase
LAPDGSRLAYDTLTSLRVRSIAGDDIATGSRGGAPFFSPDGLWLAFFTENGLHRMPAGGGAAQLITAERSGRERAYGGTWGLDGTIVFARGGGLFRVSAEKGEVQTVIDPDTAAGELFYGWPEFLPDGRSVLFTIMMRAGGAANARIAVVDLTTRQRKTLIEGGLAARYLRTGHLLYATGGRLQIVSFDERRLETRGVPSTLQGVSIATTVGGFNADFDVSDNGTFAYASVGTPVLRTLAWVDLAGREEPIPAPPRPYAYPRISPDGTRVALEIFSGGNRDIWVLKFAHGVPTQISRGPTEDLMSVWSPDSARVYYGSNRMGGLFRIFSVDADGAGTEQEVFAGSDSYMPLHMPAPDTLISFASGEADPDFVAALPLGGGGGAARTLLGGPGRQGPAEVSPDGRMIAYQMVEPTTAGDPGTPEVIVRSYPDVDRRRKTISSGGGMHPLWGPAGSNNLFYWTPKGELKVVSVTSTPEIDVGNVRDVPLGAGFFTPLPNTSWNYAVSPVDGRILLLKPVPGSGVPGPINVTVNWFEELKRLTTN